jgi:hypothetical protein
LEVVARPLAIGTGLAEAGDGAIDEARIRLAQVLEAEAVTREIAILVVLDQDIALRGELARNSLALGERDVERERPLAAVRGAEIGRVLGLLAFAVADPGRTEGA